MAVALTACSGRGVTSYPELVLATGPPGAVFREIGGALATELHGAMPQTKVTVLGTGASTENLRLLDEGRAHLGISSLDAAAADPDGVAAIGRLYDSYLHLVVRADSEITDFDDLTGKRVSFGATGSGTEYTMLRLTALTGLDVDDMRMDQAASARALAKRDIDAMFSLTGIPTPAITDLLRHQALRCLPLDRQAADLAEAYPGSYFPATIPATAYPGLPPCPTLSIPNVLLARTDIPDTVARTITETVFTTADAMAATRPEAAQINVRTGIATSPIPLHPGAVGWFRDQKA
ncbi:C4-dicarboxylate ABC transporter substrate-binding protein [Nocardiopsis gilva YIM 90087]|uniref:C4-dicarboxylate ABC transporter substrate-binding protein n=1 Tax=Nocardiopsis gilva YIM 90087 TaxID=1235441 RepID=A0A223S1T7_9ACTN|nr:C4-dicarboxylate ABC transporter substrate-binding protein [Nocardiopsis gilva YIM 90087]